MVARPGYLRLDQLIRHYGRGGDSLTGRPNLYLPLQLGRGVLVLDFTAPVGLATARNGRRACLCSWSGLRSIKAVEAEPHRRRPWTAVKGVSKDFRIIHASYFLAGSGLYYRARSYPGTSSQHLSQTECGPPFLQEANHTCSHGGSLGASGNLSKSFIVHQSFRDRYSVSSAGAGFGIG